MRQLILLLIGLLAGAIAATMVANMLQQRRAYPRGLMRVLQHHIAELRAAERRDRCADAALATHFTRIAELSHDIAASVYVDPLGEPRMVELAGALRDAATAGRSAPASSCIALSAALRTTTEACDTCHREYR